MTHKTYLILVIALVCAMANVASAQATSVLTTGLNTPTKMIIAGQSSLLVAESGTMTPNNGRISVVNRTTGVRQTLIDGLPSGLNRGGGAPEPSGPGGLKLSADKLYLTIGAGDTALTATGGFIVNPAPSSVLFNSVLELTLPSDYETLASGFTMSAANQATLNGASPVTLTNAEGKQLTIRLVANLPNFSAEPLPALAENIRESNLFGVELSGNSLYIVDASFNLLYRVNIAIGAAEVFTTFERRPNPTQMGPPFIEPVPDSIRLVGNNLLVSFLGGFPFPAGFAEVRSINLNTRTQTVFISGLTAALDVLPYNGTGDGDSFLALEFSAAFLAQQPGRLKLFTSRTEPSRTLLDNLITPTSLARDAQSGSIFITERSPGRITRLSSPRAAPLDYFATGRSDYTLLSTSASGIRWDFLRNPAGQPPTRQVFWGVNGDTPVYGDYDGDLRMDVGVWRPGTAANPQSFFFIQRSGNSDLNAISSQPWGLLTDKPIVGDYDGDGKDDFAVARVEGPNLAWYVLRSNGGSVQRTVFGLATDSAFSGEDFNNDGREDLIVTRADQTGAITSYVGDAVSGNLLLAQQWGNNNAAQGGAVAVFYGNYSGDSRTDIGVYYGSCPTNPTCENAGTFWIKETGSENFTVTRFGIPFNGQTAVGDLRSQGDFDGDGKLDITVFRPTNRTFYSLLSTNGQIRTQSFDAGLGLPPSTASIFGDAHNPTSDLISPDIIYVP